MPDGEFASVGVLQVRDPFVPSIALEAPQIVPSDEWSLALNLELRLECISLVADVIGCGRALIDQKYRNRTCAGRQRHRTNGNRQSHSLASRNFLFDWLVRSRRQFNRESLLAAVTLPDLTGIAGALFRMVVAPTNDNLQRFGWFGDEETDPDR